MRMRKHLQLTLISSFLLTVCLGANGQIPDDPELKVKYDEAQQLSRDARKLRDQGNDESRRMAIQKFTEAANLFNKSGSFTWQAGTLSIIADTYFSLNDISSSIEFKNKSIEISRSLGREIDMVSKLMDLGVFYRLSGEREKAKTSYEQALTIVRKRENIDYEARVLGQFGSFLQKVGEYDKAIELLKQALPVFARNGDDEQLADANSAIGDAFKALDKNHEAIEHYSKSLTLFRVLGKMNRQASALYSMGSAYAKMNEKQKALELYEQCLELEIALDDRDGQAGTLHTFGLFYYDLDENQKALDYLNRSLNLRKGTGKKEEAAILRDIGDVYSSMDDIKRSVEYYDQALSIYRALGNKADVAHQLGVNGSHYVSIGEYKKSLDNYEQALKIYENLGDQIRGAGILNRLGLVYSELGENTKALNYFDKALVIYKDAKDKKAFEGTVLQNIGLVYNRTLGDSRKALEYYERALQLIRASEDKEDEATILHNIGAALSDLNDNTKAIDYLTRSLKLRNGRDGKVATLSYLGKVYVVLGENEKALDFLNQALSLSKAYGLKRREAIVLERLMAVWINLKNPYLAVLYGKESINIYQKLRTQTLRINTDVQRSFLGSIEGAYRKLATILLQEQRNSEAEQVIRMLKEDEYYTFVEDPKKAHSSSKSELSSDEQKTSDVFEQSNADLAIVVKELEFLERKKNSLPDGQTLSLEDQSEYDRLKAKHGLAIEKFQGFLEGLKLKFGQKNAQVVAIDSDNQGLLKRLNEPQTVLISTILGEEGLNIILTTSAMQKGYFVKDSQAVDVNNLVDEFRALISNPRKDPRSVGEKLYKKLFPPELMNDLDRLNPHPNTIVWSLDGKLRYLPIAALWDGEKYLAERYRNVVITNAGRDKLGETSATSRWSILGVGVSKAAPGFSPLPSVPMELCSIVNDPLQMEFCRAQLTSVGVFSGQVFTDDEFTLQNFTNNIGRNTVIHISSHFALKPGDEKESYLLLGGRDERKYSLADFRNIRLDNVDLLTLSACNTGMTPGNKSNGIEIENFGAMAQKQGAKSVLATLWPVADESTALWMAEFYRLKKENPTMTKAAAMQSAQKAMIEGMLKSSGKDTGCRAKLYGADEQAEFKCDPNAPFTHPYFWAPFILFGNWQ